MADNEVPEADDILRALTTIAEEAADKGADASTELFQQRLKRIIEDSAVISTATGATRQGVLQALFGLLKGNNSKKKGEPEDSTIVTQFVDKYKALEVKYKEALVKLQEFIEYKKRLEARIKQLEETLKAAKIAVPKDNAPPAGNASAQSTSSLGDLFKNIDRNDPVSLSQALEAAEMDIRRMRGRIEFLQFELAQASDRNDAVIQQSSDAIRNFEAIQSELRIRDEEIARLQQTIQQIQGQLSAAKNANADVIALREQLLSQIEALATLMTESVKTVRKVGEGEVLASYFSFQMIEKALGDCITIFSQLKENILEKIGLFSTTVKAYEAVTEKAGKANGIPSFELLQEIMEVLGKLKALKELQDQLVTDTVDEQAGANAQDDVSGVPPEFVKDGKIKDYYSVLEVSPTADADEIKKAYRRLSMKFHPDRNPGDATAEEKFKEINEAYSVLSDLEKKATYDSYFKK